MIDLGWAAPANRIDADSARRRVLWQHDQIRAFLVKVHGLADAALDGEVSSPDEVACAIGDLCSIMEVHLVFEESVLLPILRDDVPLGPARAEQLLDEHHRQKGMLAGLLREARITPPLPTLAAKLAFLTSWLLADMAEEERCLLIPEVVRDDSVVIDQTCG